MKLLLIKGIILFYLGTIGSDIKEFTQFTCRNFRAPLTVEKDCNWQYAIVKLNLDPDGLVNQYEVLEDPNHKFSNAFNYLINYKISKSISSKRSIIFCLGIENLRNEGCDIPEDQNKKYKSANEILRIYKASHPMYNKTSKYLYNDFIFVIYPILR